ncbi:MAG: nucleotidyltransferase family protein [Hyphomicrobiales bacterium]
MASAAWKEWRRGYALDETPWNEVRLLGTVSRRIDWLEPNADISPRIRGIQKFLYSQSQMCLVGAVKSLRSLSAGGIPMLFMKGAARVASNDRDARERLVRDIDLLVPISHMDEAYDRLVAEGWELRGAWQRKWRNIDKIASHHAWSMSKGKSEIDLHHFSNNINRLVGDDECLWARAGKFTWRGISVHVPSATDNLIIAIIHGLRWSRECNADWIIDGFAALSTHEVDWPLMLEEVEKRRIAAIIHAGLWYMRTALAAPVPGEVFEALQQMAGQGQLEELQGYYSLTPLPANMMQNRFALRMALERCGSLSTAPLRTVAPLALEGIELGRYRLLDVSRTLEGGTLALSVNFWPACAPGTRLIGTVVLFGLVLDCREGVVTVEDGGRPICRITFTLNGHFLRRRNATRLAVRFISYGSAPIMTWLQDMPAHRHGLGADSGARIIDLAKSGN